MHLLLSADLARSERLYKLNDSRRTIPAKARAINEVLNALKLGQQWTVDAEDTSLCVVNGISTQSPSQDSCGYEGDCTSPPLFEPPVVLDPTLDGWHVRRHLSCGMLYASGVVSLVRMNRW